ncbi:MAG: class I SAM-dependent methyltransferase [Microthrixaceae bacterium]
MGFYSDRVLPPVIDRALSTGHVKKHRSHVVPEASGVVLELGFGTGTNLEFYDPGRVTEVLAVDPASGARSLAERRIGDFARPVRWIGLDGASLSLGDASVDTVVAAFTLCTIPDVESAIAEVRRVLRPGGEFRYLEHGLHADPRVARRQARIEKVWKPLAGGCHLTRNADELVTSGGFVLRSSEHHTMPGPTFTTALYEGVAVPA